ncbi:MAG: effector-associated domain EAD1-containing protein [Scytonema sp. PMC 1070.18]|nr:effector-associated domain EAD1-containing protein [Scytonema sp. PMC 1070.18]
MIKLSGSEQGELLNAILDAYPDIGDLKILVKITLEQNLSAIAGGNNYKQIVFHLIQWTESQGFTRELIQALYQDRYENQEFQNLINKLLYRYSYLGVSPHSGIISVKQWNELYEILSQIDIGLVSQICRKTLSNIQDDISGNYLNLSDRIDLIELRKILLQQRPQRKDGVPTIIEFVERLTKKIQEPLKNQLTTWLQTISQILNVPLPTFSESQTSYTKQSYLLIILEPHSRESNKVTLNAELFPEYKPNLNYQKSVKLDLDSEKTNVECYYTEIAHTIYEFINKSEEQYLQEPYELTIEIFLPYKYIGEGIDIERIPIDNEKKQYMPIGHQYQLLVRSYERYRQKKYINNLRKRWIDLEESVNNQELNNKIADLHKIDSNIWERLVLQWETERKLGIRIVGCGSEYSEEREQLFRYLVRGGIPIAVWTRCKILANTDLDTELKQILTIQSLQDRKNLLKLIWDYRQDAHSYGEQAQNYLGYYLGVLCDDPNRIPEILQPQSQYEAM